MGAGSRGGEFGPYSSKINSSDNTRVNYVDYGISITIEQRVTNNYEFSPPGRGNDMGGFRHAGEIVETIVTISGYVATYYENSYVRQGYWRSTQNHQWYRPGWGGNQYTGPRSVSIRIGGTLRIAGRGLFWFGAAMTSVNAITELSDGANFMETAGWAIADITMARVSMIFPYGTVIGISYFIFTTDFQNSYIGNEPSLPGLYYPAVDKTNYYHFPRK